MSISTVEIIIGRIDSASEKSPIAVFKLPNPDGEKLEAVFGATTATMQRIKSGDKLFLGNYHNGMDREQTKANLKNAARKLAA